jgi:hypothetical protein
VGTYVKLQRHVYTSNAFGILASVLVKMIGCLCWQHNLFQLFQSKVMSVCKECSSLRIMVTISELLIAGSMPSKGLLSPPG